MMPLNCDLIGVDQEGGAYLAGQLFRELGITKACFLGRSTVRDQPRYDPLSAIRLRGFEAGLGAEVAQKHRIDSGGYSLTAGGRALTRYLAVRDRPKAIFAASDDIAIGFLVAAASHQLEAGRDFHLVGFDGHGMGRRIPEGPLTTVEVPAQAMGRAAAEAAANRLLQPDRPLQATTLACHLFVGRTVSGVAGDSGVAGVAGVAGAGVISEGSGP
jgi:LacI family repressor for deo operon, udp, cdd, tsx, nupC, and nupG